MSELCACGGRVTTYRRWADTPARPLLAVGALASIVWGAVATSVPWIVGGAIALAGALLVHKLGVAWWGGRRCRACGETLMLR